MRKNYLRRVMIPAIVSASVIFALTACGGSGEPETTTAEETTTEAVETQTTTEETTTEEIKLNTIGKEEAGSISFEFTNKTGRNIVKVALNNADDDVEGKNLLEDGDAFENDETRLVYFAIPEDEDATEETSDGTADDAAEEETSAEDGNGEKELTTEYTVSITLDDDKEYTLHAFPVNDIKEGSVKVEDDVAYIEYKALTGDETISTLNAEKAVKEKADAEAEEVTMATAAPAQEPVYEVPVYQEPIYEEPVYQEPVYEEPVYVEPAAEAPAVEGDDCVGDGLVY